MPSSKFVNIGRGIEWPGATDAHAASKDHSGMRNDAHELSGPVGDGGPENETNQPGGGGSHNAEEDLDHGHGVEYNGSRGMSQAGGDIGLETSRGGKRIGSKNTTR